MSSKKHFTFFTKEKPEEKEIEQKILAAENRPEQEKEKREEMVLEELRQINSPATGKTAEYDKGKMMAMMIISSIIKFCIIAIMFTSIVMILIEVAPKFIAFFGKFVRMFIF